MAGPDEGGRDKGGRDEGGRVDTAGDRVVVVGAGVVGCAVAHRLVPDHDVVVLERDQVAGAATARAAGVVGLAGKYTEIPGLVRHTADFFEDFDGTGTFEFEPWHYLDPVLPGDETDAHATAADIRATGASVEYLDADAVEARFPRFDVAEYAGALVHAPYPGRGFVDPYAFATSLKSAAEAEGAAFRTGIAVERVAVENGTAVGVETAEGGVAADHVVVAAGWHTPDLLADAVELPVRPYRTQCVVLDPDPPCGDDVPMGNVPGEHVYFKPEPNGDFLVGGHSHPVADPKGASEQADADFVDHVADVVPRVFPDMADAGFVDGWAGVDAATPDTRPIVDAPADAPEGLVVATGFNGLGIMTAPAAAAAVRAMVTGREAPFDPAVFALDRFDSRSRDFEFVSVSDH